LQEVHKGGFASVATPPSRRAGQVVGRGNKKSQKIEKKEDEKVKKEQEEAAKQVHVEKKTI
jgi:hypothetical protein